MFRAEKTMFMPPVDISLAAWILGKNSVCLLFVMVLVGGVMVLL